MAVSCLHGHNRSIDRVCGPVGLSLALQCARHDMAFKIVDAAPLLDEMQEPLDVFDQTGRLRC